MRIYSIHYNKPEYIDIQYNSFKKNIKFNYEFIILDNSIDIEIKKNIKIKCEQLDIKYIDCINNIRLMDSTSHQNALSKLVDIIEINETFMLLDHDIFIINELTEDFFSNYDLLFVNQTRGNVDYPWPGLMIFNKLKNKDKLSFNSGLINGYNCDTGGAMYYFLKNNNLKIKKLDTKYLNNSKELMQTHENIFLHLISGSDWNKDYDLESKLDKIKIYNIK